MKTILAIIHQESAPAGYFAAKLPELGYDVEVASYADGPEPKRELSEYAGVIVFGGAPMVDEEDRFPWLIAEKRALVKALETDVPILGICLGMQLLAELSGARVGAVEDGRAGWATITLCEKAASDPIFAGLPQTFETIVWHGYGCELPSGATRLAVRGETLHAFRLTGKPVWGVQFHPEATPEIIGGWIEALRAREPRDVTDEFLADYAERTARLSPDHERLATNIMRGFIEAAVKPREQRLLGHAR